MPLPTIAGYSSLYPNCNPDIDLAEFLGRRLPMLQAGKSLFASPTREVMNREVENQALFVLLSGGEEFRHRPGCNTMTRRYRLKLLIRSKRGKNSYTIGQELARAVGDAVTIAIDSPKSWPAKFCDFSMIGGTPAYAGRDEDDQHIWTMNVRVEIEIPIRPIFVGASAIPLVCDPDIFDSLEMCGKHPYRVGTYFIEGAAGDTAYIALPDEFGVPVLEGYSLFCTQTLDNVVYNIYSSDDPIDGDFDLEVL